MNSLQLKLQNSSFLLNITLKTFFPRELCDLVSYCTQPSLGATNIFQKHRLTTLDVILPIWENIHAQEIWHKK